MPRPNSASAPPEDVPPMVRVSEKDGPPAALARVPAERARDPPLPQALRLVGQQAPAPDLGIEAAPRVAPRDTSAEVRPEAGLRVAAVVAHAELHRRRQHRAVAERDRQRAFQTEPQPRHSGLGGREPPRHRVGRGLRDHRVGLRGEREAVPEPAACPGQRSGGSRPGVDQDPAQPGRRHPEVEVGADRVLAVGLERERALAVAGRAPDLDPVGERMAAPGVEPGQRRGDGAAAGRRAVAAFAGAVADDQPGQRAACPAGLGLRSGAPAPVGAQHRARHLAVDAELVLAPVEARHRATAPHRDRSPARAGTPGFRRHVEGRAEQKVVRSNGAQASGSLRPGRRSGNRTAAGRLPQPVGEARRPVLRPRGQRRTAIRSRRKRPSVARPPADALARERCLRTGQTRRPYPALHGLEHLLGHRAPEPCGPRLRHRVGVANRASGLRVVELHSRRRGIGECEGQGLAALVVGVVEDCNRDRLRRLADCEGERARGRRVVGAGCGGVVRCCVRHRHRGIERFAERHPEVECCAFGLVHRRVRHRERRRTGHGERERSGERASARIAHAGGGVAVGGGDEAQRHWAEA